VYVSYGTVRSASLLEGGRSAPCYAIKTARCNDIVGVDLPGLVDTSLSHSEVNVSLAPCDRSVRNQGHAVRPVRLTRKCARAAPAAPAGPASGSASSRVQSQVA